MRWIIQRRDLIRILFGIFTLMLSYQTISERIYRIPVPILPKYGDRLDALNTTIYWHPVSGIPKYQQQFDIELASDIDFKRVVYRKTTDETRLPLRKMFISGTVYYRVRLILAEKTYPWCKPIKFYRLISGSCGKEKG